MAGGANVDPARRADRRHEPRRDRARRRPDPPHQRRAHAADRRARHERRVRPGRPHLGAGLRRDHRQRHAGRDPRATPRSRKPISARRRTDAARCATSTPTTARATSCRASTSTSPPGEVVSLLGRNGVGRSTTVKAIMGEVAPTGSIRFKGRDIAGLPSYRIARFGLGYVPENRDIFPSLTVRQNLLLGQKDPRRQGRWRLKDMLDMFPNLRPASTRPRACCRAAKSRC